MTIKQAIRKARRVEVLFQALSGQEWCFRVSKAEATAQFSDYGRNAPMSIEGEYDARMSGDALLIHIVC